MERSKVLRFRNPLVNSVSSENLALNLKRERLTLNQVGKPRPTQSQKNLVSDPCPAEQVRKYATQYCAIEGLN